VEGTEGEGREMRVEIEGRKENESEENVAMYVGCM